MAKAIFAAGCFWGVQYYFDQIPGVTKSLVGYTGGHTENPRYEDVCTHITGHAEAVELEYDESQVSFEVLVRQFFHMHDPTQLNRQGPDIGDSYRSAVFYLDESQKQIVETVCDELAPNLGKPIVTQIVPATNFYEAEEYHQKFAERTGRGACHVPHQPMQ